MVGVRWVESTDRKRSHREEELSEEATPDQPVGGQCGGGGRCGKRGGCDGRQARGTACAGGPERPGSDAGAVQSGCRSPLWSVGERQLGPPALPERPNGRNGWTGRTPDPHHESACALSGWLGRVASGQLRGTAGHRPPGANGAGAHDRGTLHAERPVRSGAGRCGGGGTRCRYGEVLGLPSLHRPDGGGAGRAPRSPAERGGPGRG